VLTFKKNESYTGEQTAEVHCHGSIAVIEKLISVLVECGSVLKLRPQRRESLLGKLFIMGRWTSHRWKDFPTC
ncbi:MAG: hypothetical protein ACJZ8S_04450, partial [Paracoccaceae bacterium]